MTWRKRAEPVIAAVLDRTRGMGEESIKAALFKAYPFGPRKYHPYKIWLDEIKRQRGLKPKPGARKKLASKPVDDDQGDLFG